MRRIALFVGLFFWGALAGARPVVAILTTCARLGVESGAYPSDTINWFDAAKDNQVVFFAHLLFPLGQKALTAAGDDWHAPLSAPPSGGAQKDSGAPKSTVFIADKHAATVQWLDPDGQEIGMYHVTLSARSTADVLRLAGEDYVPHTVAMAIGIRDIRPAAGQTRIPDKVGQYQIRLSVDQEALGLAFFRIMRTSAATGRTPTAAPLQMRESSIFEK